METAHHALEDMIQNKGNVLRKNKNKLILTVKSLKEINAKNVPLGFIKISKENVDQ